MSGEGTEPRARLALVLRGDPRDPRSWSGVPSKLADALEAIGCEVVAVDAEVPRGRTIRHRLKMTWADQEASRAFAAASGLVVRAKLAGAGGVEAVIALDSGYVIGGSVPVVSFDDMTVATTWTRSWRRSSIPAPSCRLRRAIPSSTSRTAGRLEASWTIARPRR